MTGRSAPGGRAFRAAAVGLGCLVIGACGADENAGSGRGGNTALSIDTIIRTESGQVGTASGLAVDSGGNLWLTDAVNHRLLVVSPDGKSIRAIGREGRGPLEFRNPAGIAIGPSEVYVCEIDNVRVQRLSLAGEYLGVSSVAAALYVPVSINARGDLAVMTMGRAGRLAEVIAGSDGGSRLVGEAVEAMPSVISSKALREQALRGEVPREFRNLVRPVLGSGGAVWVIGLADGRVQLFSSDGEPSWTNSLPQAELEAALEAYFAAWRSQPTGFHVPIVARAAAEVGGQLWVMMDRANAAGSVIVALSRADGSTTGRMELALGSRAGEFAVDVARSRLYLSLPEEAAILATRIPPHMRPGR